MTEKTIVEFIDALKSEQPTPGGGGASALVSANGVALVMMVANLTLKHRKYAEWHELCNEVVAEAEPLLKALIVAIDKDAEMFGLLMDAFKTGDKLRIGKASVDATEQPFHVIENSVKALELCKKLLGKSNPGLESDLYVAAHCLKAGMESAIYSIEANLPGIEKLDPKMAEKFRSDSTWLLEQGEKIASSCVSLARD